MEMAYSNGLMVPSIMDNGKIIRCMAQVNFVGLMAESIEENMLMIRSMVKVYIPGPTDACIKVIFKMENSMEKAYIGRTMDKRSTAYGKKVRRLRSSIASKSSWKSKKK